LLVKGNNNNPNFTFQIFICFSGFNSFFGYERKVGRFFVIKLRASPDLRIQGGERRNNILLWCSPTHFSENHPMPQASKQARIPMTVIAQEPVLYQELPNRHLLPHGHRTQFIHLNRIAKQLINTLTWFEATFRKDLHAAQIIQTVTGNNFGFIWTLNSENAILR
jgi:hypothetical protein